MRKICVCLLLGSLTLWATACRRDDPRNNTTDLPGTVKTIDVELPSRMAEGKVLEVIDTGKYTYVQVDTGSEKIWAAALRCNVEVGDELKIGLEMPMKDWRSPTLERTFDMVYFVQDFLRTDGTPVPRAGQGPAEGDLGTAHSSGPQGLDVGAIEKAEGGKTVAEIHAGKADLAGQEVIVRGRVTKYNPEILERNWLHVQDGSGSATDGDHDLTVTTSDTAKVGDIVVVTGKVQTDRDFTFGYKYDVIIEDATVVVE